MNTSSSRTGSWWRHWLALIVALVILDLSVTFENAWPTPGIRWRGRISIELALCVLALGSAVRLRRSPLSQRTITAFSLAWLALVIGRYAAVTTPALYGREVNLYWDLRFLPDVAAMVARVAPLWLVVVWCAAVATAFMALYLLLRWSWATVSAAVTTPTGWRTVLTAAASAALLFAATERPFATPVTPAYARQARFVVGAFARTRPLPGGPPFDSDLARVKGADVFLVFVESYGAVSYERADIAAGLAGAMARFDAAIHETNRDAVSAYVESPTFGGSSWFAHVSLLSGVEVRDPDVNARLMVERRDTLVRLFGRRGFRTIALMPGLRQRWPEGAFYGFDEIYSAARLAYHGPPFGWFAIPDQFSLHALDRLEVDRQARQPLFVFFPTISTHFPFSPTPPYQPDWRRMSDSRPYDGADIVRAYAREPDWTHFAPGYIDAIAYDFTTIGGYLRLHRDRDFVMILLGDHQPPAALSGEGTAWDVPVHIVTGRADLLDRALAAGFRRGLSPVRPAVSRMHTLVPILLDAFGSRDGHHTHEIVPSESGR